MAIGYCNVHTHSRKAGHSVAAALAYRFGTKLTDCRTQEIHDYRKRETREDIAATGIETSRPTPLAESAQAFATATETAERRCDSRLCRDVVVALPDELPEPARIALAQDFAIGLAKRYRTVTAWAVHRPGERGDDRNHHAHVLMPTRALDKKGNLGAKLERLDNPRYSGGELARIRNLWASHANRALKNAGLDEQISIGRRLDQAAIKSVPGSALALEQKAVLAAETQSYLDALGLEDQPPTDEQKATARALAKADLAHVATRELIIHANFQGVTNAGTATAAQVIERTVRAVREGTRNTPIYAPKARSRMSRWREAQERAKKAKGAERPGSRPDHEAEAQPTVPKGAATPQRPARQRRRRVRTAPEPAVVAQLGDLHPAPQESEAIIFGSLALVRPDPEAPATAPEPEAAPPPPPRKRRRRARPATHAALVPAAQPRPGPESSCPEHRRAHPARADQAADRTHAGRRRPARGLRDPPRRRRPDTADPGPAQTALRPGRRRGRPGSRQASRAAILCPTRLAASHRRTRIGAVGRACPAPSPIDPLGHRP